MSIFTEWSSYKWGDWLRGIWSAGISAAAGAVMSVLMANPVAQIVGANAFTPRQTLVFAGLSAVFAALFNIAGFLQKSPWPERAVQIALIPGVHTEDQVKEIAKQTAPGSVPTPETAKAIIADMPKGTP